MAVLSGDLQFEKFYPDYGCVDGKPFHSWTRCRIAGHEIANRLDAIAWQSVPVCPIFCEVCGLAECGPQLASRVSRIGDTVFWMKVFPEFCSESFLSHWNDIYKSLLSEHVVILERSQWNQIRSYSPQAPAFDELPLLTRLEFAWALQESRPRAISLWNMATQFAADLPVRIVASDPLDLQTTEHFEQRLQSWLAAEPLAVVQGTTERLNHRPRTLQRVYFDSTDVDSLALFDVESPWHVVLGPWLVLLDAA